MGRGYTQRYTQINTDTKNEGLEEKEEKETDLIYS